MRAQPQRVYQPADHGTLGRLSRRDIVNETSRVTADSGERYWRDRKVVALDVGENDDSVRIKARVQGSGKLPYGQTIDVWEDLGSTIIEGECTCAVGFNCKHVAAVMFAAMARANEGRSPLHVVTGRPSRGVPASKAAPAPALDPRLSGWIDALVQLEQSESEDYPDDLQQRLLYLLFPCETQGASPHAAPQIAVNPTSARLLKSGRFSEHATSFDPGNVFNGNVGKFLRPSDRDILRRLCDLRHAGPRTAGIVLLGEAAQGVIEAVIATGRARWRVVEGPVVTRGPARRARLAWRLADDGTQVPHFAVDDAPHARLLRVAPPWYVDTVTAEGAATTEVMGPLETGFAPRIAAEILAAPPVPLGQNQVLRSSLARRLPALAALEPPELSPPRQVGGAPVPTLRLMVLEPARDWPLPLSMLTAPGKGGAAVARPCHRYGDVEVAVHDTRDRPTFARDGRIVEVTRDRPAEFAAAAQLTRLGFDPLSEHFPYGLPDASESDLVLSDGSEWNDFLYREVPKLRAAGWDVDIAEGFPIRLVVPDGDIDAELHESSGIDWFDLDLGVIVGGERIDLVPAILKELATPDFRPAAAAEDRPYYLKLGDGRTLAMPANRIRPIIATLYELFTSGAVDPEARRLGLSWREAAAIAALEAAGIAWRGGERLRELGRLLRETGSIPQAELPATFTATLRPYQARGVDWLQFLRSADLGGVLADDMGLGKTVQALAHLAIEKAQGRMDRPALVVAPTSVLPNWRREAERFAPDLRVLVLHGLERKSRFSETADHDLVLTTYPLLARDHAVLKAQPWHVIVLDEAQVIKNPNAATTQLVFDLEARHRLCLTGTPLENHLGEVWSLFAFLSPGFLGDRESFRQQWRTPIEKRGDGERRRLLARRVRPFLLRRTKSEVATELPPKTEIVEQVVMDTVQREIYESIRLAMHTRVRQAIAAKGLARSRIVLLDALLKLRQACCDPRLVRLTRAARAGSAKLERVMEMLPELIEAGRRVLLFSQFTSMLALIQEQLRTAGIDHVLLTGDTRDRETPVKRFQAGRVPLFLISLKAGGTGLNLTAADTVIHYDPWWNPAVEDQATDRAHRIGQDKPVFVHKLVTVDSIEEKIEVLKSRKRDLARGLFDPDGGSALDLTEADIQDLFAVG